VSARRRPSGRAYLVNSIQEVYRLQVSTSMTSTRDDRSPDDALGQGGGRRRDGLLLEEQIDKFRFREENDPRHRRWRTARDRAAIAARHHQGVALTDRSFSAASFQETTRVLTEAASPQVDYPARPQGKRHHRAA